MATALITGASSGLGAEYARQLAPAYDLILVARNEARMQSLAQSFSSGRKVKIIAADLTKAVDVERVELAVAEAADLQLLVNNAGLGTVGKFSVLDAVTEKNQVLLNVNALVALSHAALGNFSRNRPAQAALINVASVAGFQPTPFSAVYAASKAFVKTFSEGIAEEVRGDGVIVQCLCPGLTRTEFQERGHIDVSSLPDFAWMSAEEVVRISLANLSPGSGVVLVPGLLNQAMALASSAVPSALNARLMAGVMKSALNVRA